MIVKYTMKMTISDEIIVANELAYRLYAMLLSKAAPEFGEYVHQCDITPVSQNLTIDNKGGILWNVSLLNDTAIREIGRAHV